MKKPYLAIAALTASVVTSHAATLVWSANLARNGFDQADGTDLSVGSLIRAGTFDLTDSQIIQNSGTPAGYQFLLQHFTEFAVTHIGEGVNNNAGHFSDSDINITTAAALAGKQIYLWAIFSSNTSNDAAKISSATQQGIFYMPFTSNSAWQFPGDAEFGSTSIGLKDLTDVATSNSLAAQAKVLIGTFGPGVSAVSGKTDFMLASVPEPSTVGALLGGTAILMWRRRRS